MKTLETSPASLIKVSTVMENQYMNWDIYCSCKDFCIVYQRF